MRTIGMAIGLACLASACAIDDEEPTAVEETEIIAANKLAANKLAANKLAANKLAANKLAASSLETKELMDTADGREVMSFIVGCALPTGQNLVLTSSAGTSYTFPGWLNLAPGWATRTPTSAERKWVTACVLARTNLYGVQVNISMRHDTNLALATSQSERDSYTAVEGGFFGDLFANPPALYACAKRAWTRAPTTSSKRACALSQNGTTTECGFTYVGLCNREVPACTDSNAPYGHCTGGGVSYKEVVTIFLNPGDVQ